MLNRPNKENIARIAELHGLVAYAWHEKFGIVGLHRYLFTYGILAGCSDTGYTTRWCYETRAEAMGAFTDWTLGLTDEPVEYIRRLPPV